MDSVAPLRTAPHPLRWKILRPVGWLLLVLPALLAGGERNRPSPENQVFQFVASAESAPWPDGSTHPATGYLWIPESCQRLRGLLVLGTNVPEHGLVGDPPIRRVCQEENLGILWCVPSFWRFGKIAPGPGLAPVDVKGLEQSNRRQVELLELLLGELAAKSGYGEVSTVPWLPMGESGHLLMVAGLIDERPERCIAGICIKNPITPHNRTVPLLWTLGTAQEWGQMKVDLVAHWKNTTAYPAWMAERAAGDWPLSLVLEPGTGHFGCTPEMTRYFADYIQAIVQLRLPPAGNGALRPVSLGEGVLADLPRPESRSTEILAYASTRPEERARPWFPNGALATAAQRFSDLNWNEAPQFLGFLGGNGTRVLPFSLNSVTQIEVATTRSFVVQAEPLPRIPDGFVNAGQSLARQAGPVAVDWVCGPIAPAGHGMFAVALDRTWKTGAACYVVAKAEGEPGIRRAWQPARVTLLENRAGLAQKIEFVEPGEIPAGTKRVRLRASSSAGLPVSFFVRAGPAVIEGNEVVLTPIPPRARWPIEIAITAWQWGQTEDPPVQTAPTVTRILRVTPSPPTAPP